MITAETHETIWPRRLAKFASCLEKMRRLRAEKVSQELPPLLSPSVFVSEKCTPFSLTFPAPLQEFVLTVIVDPQVQTKFSVSSTCGLLSGSVAVFYDHRRLDILFFICDNTALPC